jgi:hypothetical protein
MSDSETIRRMEISVSEPRGGSRVQSMGMDLCLVIIQNVLETVRAQERSTLKWWVAALCQASRLRLRFEG